MTPETQALIETLEMFIDTEKARRNFDMAEQPEDAQHNWSPEMQTAMQQLDELHSGTLIVTRKE